MEQIKRIKISQLESVNILNDSDNIAIVQNSKTRKISGKVISDKINNIVIENTEKLKENIQEDINTLSSDISKTNSQLEEINNKIDICPDDFSGTDSQKIQSAFNYCINNNGINNIKLNRKYDITGSEIMFEVDSFWRFISFEGGEIVKNDEGFIFNSTLSGNGRNSPKFTKTIITTNADNVYLYNGNKMIRQYCDNVVFRKVGCIKTTSYLQTLRLHNCEIGQLGCNFIDADHCFDCEIVHCRFESSTKFNAIKIQTNGEGISYFGLRIKNNLLEGYVYTTPIVIGIGYGLDISTNYFEANNTSLIIDNNGEKSTLVSGNIENNVFGGNKSDYDIFISSKVNTHRLTLLKCTTNASVGKYLCNIYLIKDYIDTNNCYAGGKICPDTSVRSVRNSSFKVTQNDLGVGGISFEIPLNIKDNGNIASLFNRQYLVTINATFGSSVWYKAHLVGILSIDGQYIKGEVKHELLFTILSTRNTSGNNNGSVENKAVYSYYFKETMTKLIDPSASVATIVFEFSALKYNTSNKCNFKGINSIIQQYEEDM